MINISKYIEKKLIIRFLLGFCLILSIWFSIYYPPYTVNPSNNLTKLQKMVINTQNEYTTSGGYLHIYRNYGYVLVLYTGLDDNYAPIEYLTIANENNSITIDLITGAGEENTSQLTGEDAIIFLKKHQLDLSLLNATIEK